MVERYPGRLRHRLLGAFLLTGCAAALAFPACTVDKDHPCGDDLDFWDNTRCICPKGTVYTPDGCIECGAHEVVDDTQCVCEPGYERDDSGACEESMGSGGSGGGSSPGGAGGDGGSDSGGELGAECDPDEPACQAPFDHCEPSATSTAYCTNTCGSSDDCEDDYACNDAGVCERPPSGLLQPCSAAEDCADNEAAYCDTFMQHACLVQGCSVDPDNCFVGYECCDLTAFGIGTLCVPAGECMQ